MTGWLIVNEFLQSNKFNEIHTWLLDSAKQHGINLILKTNAEIMMDLSLDKNQNMRPVDFILFWDKDVRLANYLEQLGYPVFNSSEAIGICDDKSRTHLALMKSGIPMPKTIIVPMTYPSIGFTNFDFIDLVFESLPFPIILKECFGSFGQQVYMIPDREELQSKLMELSGQPLILQEYIPSSFGRDVRIQVVGGEVIAAMYRYSENGDFRANITNGGKMRAYTPTKEQRNLAVRCCEIIGLDFAGVDILFGEEDEPILCEVNSNAHFKNIFDCTGINVADAIIRYIKSKIKGL